MSAIHNKFVGELKLEDVFSIGGTRYRIIDISTKERFDLMFIACTLYQNHHDFPSDKPSPEPTLASLVLPKDIFVTVYL